MAILANINVHGIQINSAYIRVEQIGGSKVYDWAVIYGIYQNKEQADAGNMIEDIVLKYSFANGSHLYEQAYEILKRPDMLQHVRSVCDVSLVKNFYILETLEYVGEAQ